MAYRRPSTAVSAAGLNIIDLRALLKLDIVASNELDARIDLFRQDIKNGRRPSEQGIDEMDATNKDMTKDVVRNIEKIESQGQPSKLTTTDREVLQALHVRLATCDKQAMRLVELRDLLNEEKRKQQKEAPLPLGGKPRTPENSPSPRKVSETLRHPAAGKRPDSPGPILERVNSRDLPGPPEPRRSSEAGFGKSYTSTPSPRFAEYPGPPSPRHSGRGFPPPEFPPPVGPAAAVQSPRRSSESFFNKASSSAVPPSPRRSGSGRFYDFAAAPPSPRASSGSDFAGSASTPSPRRSPRVDTPQSEQLKYEDFYFVNGIDGDIEPDKTTWPIIYRIVDVDPSTDPRAFDGALKRALARLSLKHDPARLPHDPDAPLRWAVVCKAYDVLSDPEKKKFYDLQGIEPAGFKDLDFARLRIV